MHEIQEKAARYGRRALIAAAFGLGVYGCGSPAPTATNSGIDMTEAKQMDPLWAGIALASAFCPEMGEYLSMLYQEGRIQKVYDWPDMIGDDSTSDWVGATVGCESGGVSTPYASTCSVMVRDDAIKPLYPPSDYGGNAYTAMGRVRHEYGHTQKSGGIDYPPSHAFPGFNWAQFGCDVPAS